LWRLDLIENALELPYARRQRIRIGPDCPLKEVDESERLFIGKVHPRYVVIPRRSRTRRYAAVT
jgi:hypothetical protein